MKDCAILITMISFVLFHITSIYVEKIGSKESSVYNAYNMNFAFMFGMTVMSIIYFVISLFLN